MGGRDRGHRRGISDAADDHTADRLLVDRALDGDVDSFALLFHRHAADVHAFAQRRTRSADVADDVVSSAFEKAWRGLDRLGVGAGDGFRPWVFRIAANELASMMRSQSRRRGREAVAVTTGVLPSDGSPGRDRLDGVEAAIDAAADDASVLTALSRLPDRYQEVISLRHLAGLPAAETATSMGLSRGNVAVLLHRAMGALRREMRREMEGQ